MMVIKGEGAVTAEHLPRRVPVCLSEKEWVRDGVQHNFPSLMMRLLMMTNGREI